MKPSLLDTSTTSFQELLASRQRLAVPPFQRDYSWREEQWEDLWNDVVELGATNNENHYLGTIVLKNDGEMLEIIDGQQRLATLTIIAVAVVRRLRETAGDLLGDKADAERANLLAQLYIGGKDPTKLIELSNLTLNAVNNDFFQEYIVNGSICNASNISGSNKLLLSCLQYFYKKITEYKDGRATGADLSELLDTLVGRRLIFIRISVDNEMNAYTVFETLNARGLELTATDLLRNYLFSIVEPATRPALERKWLRIIDLCGSDRFPEFLRYYLLMRASKVRTQRLFKIVKSQTKSAEQAIELLDALHPYADAFSKLSDPKHEYWSQRKASAQYIKDLDLFKTKQMTPALFAANQVFSENEFERFLKFIRAFLFRYTVVGGKNTNALEPASSNVASAILDGRATSAREAAALLSEHYVNDGQFKQDFKTINFGNARHHKRVIRYILCTIEGQLSGRPCEFDTDPATVEHILPTNSEGETKELIDSIGNLTLLEASFNRDLGDQDYSKKPDSYLKSAYKITHKITEVSPDKWSEEEIGKRASWMADQAAHIWRSDFA